MRWALSWASGTAQVGCGLCASHEPSGGVARSISWRLVSMLPAQAPIDSHTIAHMSHLQTLLGAIAKCVLVNLGGPLPAPLAGATALAPSPRSSACQSLAVGPSVCSLNATVAIGTPAHGDGSCALIWCTYSNMVHVRHVLGQRGRRADRARAESRVWRGARAPHDPRWPALAVRRVWSTPCEGHRGRADGRAPC